MPTAAAELTRLCSPIEILFLDVDGVMTDGAIIWDNNGVESKNFHVRDGSGIAHVKVFDEKTLPCFTRRAISGGNL